jgi:hypothetical protein
MKAIPATFRSAVRSMLESTPVNGLLGKGHAIVLERIACGVGATRWYFCRDRHALAAIEGELSPGSLVSFYFDERIRKVILSPSVRSEIEQISARDGDAVVCVLEDDIHIRVDFPSGPLDLDEFASTVGPGATVFVGAFPARDNDDVRAVTVTLPDADGIVRPHPY